MKEKGIAATYFHGISLEWISNFPPLFVHFKMETDPICEGCGSQGKNSHPLPACLFFVWFYCYHPSSTGPLSGRLDLSYIPCIEIFSVRQKNAIVLKRFTAQDRNGMVDGWAMKVEHLRVKKRLSSNSRKFVFTYLRILHTLKHTRDLTL